MDPLSSLPRLTVASVLANLDDRSLARCACVSHSWRSVADADEAWSWRIKLLWEGKAYVPQYLRQLSTARSAKAAFVASDAEGSRSVITQDEICTFTWLFQFRDLGPGSWFPKNTVFRRYFHPDHSVDTRPSSEFWLEPRTWVFRWGADLAQYVQVNQYPMMKVERRADWSWAIESLWVTMASDHSAGPNPGRAALGLSGSQHMLAFYYVPDGSGHAVDAASAADGGAQDAVGVPAAGIATAGGGDVAAEVVLAAVPTGVVTAPAVGG